ncbi:MAG: hypothetical protein AVDCRST_MAG18-4959 [uncultured Thermomicrobiales bacterium]|uniref:Metallo-beta-lactamase domain-containing protein n=1 Tax=uncultured Thermomicrobiales bacterium TaxID=1645740 RepID=A0A6J4VY65_9BACT|nr:MAG: hypothetical protein AVDCRST_MAG18-4959 [uncultured Thermomicrobiales bacterium]
MNGATPEILTLRLPIVNAYLVRGRRWVLIDAGAPGDEGRILLAAERHGVRPRDIGLILLTHGHVDHFGAAAALQRATGAPIAVHRADAGYPRNGRNPDMRATGFEGRIFRPFLPWSGPTLEPDIAFADDFDPAPYGLDATVIPVPGHSPGSVAFPLSGGALIAGDLLRGGFLGGRLAPQRPNPPFYAADRSQLTASLQKVLALPLGTLYVGHGGPLTAAAVRRRYDHATHYRPSATRDIHGLPESRE